MRRSALGLLACLVLSAQTPRELYVTRCAGCHGPAGEGSRGPALAVPSFTRANDVESLTAFLRRGVPGTEMPAFAPQAIADAPLRALAAYVLSLRTTRRDSVSGRVARGAELFRGKGNCQTCHRVNGQGTASGPDLSDIGKLRDSQSLRLALLDPEKEIRDTFADYRWTIPLPNNYLLVALTTREGERVTGSRLNEDPFSLQLRDQHGRIRSFLKSDLTEVRKQWGKSPMPSYRDLLSTAELDDLVAYLASLRGLP